MMRQGLPDDWLTFRVWKGAKEEEGKRTAEKDDGAKRRGWSQGESMDGPDRNDEEGRKCPPGVPARSGAGGVIIERDV
jgi:hypothetical protein